MKRAMIMVCGAIGLGGCAQLDAVGDAVAAPPLFVLDALKVVGNWLLGILMSFGQSLLNLF